MRLSRSILVVLAAALASAPARAQQWAGPLFSSPLNHPRFEILTSDANGAGVGIAAAVRPFARVPDLRIRAGIMDGVGTGPFNEGSSYWMRRKPIAYVAGIDYAMPLSPEAGGPVRASFVTGIGVGVNAETVVSAPVGISIGYDGGRVRPYMTPRLLLEHHSGMDAPDPMREFDEGLRIKAAVDWGLDVDLPVGGTFRLSVTTGSYTGAGIGFSF